MKEKLYTIPLNDAVNANDECPFCFIERELEQNSLDFVLGNSSSYMESDIRDQTDKAGFCKVHMKKMFDYGNTLGNTLILQTHYHKLREEMKKQFDSFTPGKSSILGRFRRSDAVTDKNTLAAWAASKDCSCFICQNISDTCLCQLRIIVRNLFHQRFFHMKHMVFLIIIADMNLGAKGNSSAVGWNHGVDHF